MDCIEKIMELVCDNCHWPYAETEEGLEFRCENCKIETTILQALSAQPIDKCAE